MTHRNLAIFCQTIRDGFISLRSAKKVREPIKTMYYLTRDTNIFFSIFSRWTVSDGSRGSRTNGRNTGPLEFFPDEFVASYKCIKVLIWIFYFLKITPVSDFPANFV